MILNDALKGAVLVLSGQPWQIAIGQGTTPSWVDNLTLENEIQREDAVLTSETTNVPDDTIKFSASFVRGTDTDITEVGVFCVGVDSFILSRIVFSSITIPANQSFPITVSIPIRRP